AGARNPGARGDRFPDQPALGRAGSRRPGSETLLRRGTRTAHGDEAHQGRPREGEREPPCARRLPRRTDQDRPRLRLHAGGGAADLLGPLTRLLPPGAAKVPWIRFRGMEPPASSLGPRIGQIISRAAYAAQRTLSAEFSRLQGGRSRWKT